MVSAARRTPTHTCHCSAPRHPSAHHHLGTYARGANIPKDLLARYAQTAKFCIIAGCCVNDQCECTMRHLPAIKR